MNLGELAEVQMGYPFRSCSRRDLKYDIAEVEQDIQPLEGELGEVRLRMKQYLKELWVLGT